jgi:subtilisin family serine protease
MRTVKPLRIGIVDTGVNAWHSHVRGIVDGVRLFVEPDGRIAEDGDFRDLSGHGTAVAGIVRAAFPHARIFAVRVFDADMATYPSLVARGLLRAAAAGCDFVNLSVAVPPAGRNGALADACALAIATGCVVVASASPQRRGWLPASLPGVHAVSADDTLERDEVRELGPFELSACGRPLDLPSLSPERNFSGDSFACARGLVFLVWRRLAARHRASISRCA